jgi:hypothetical protein
MDMKEKRIWYAVQEQSSDGWDKGSYNINEAVAMLKEQGRGLIAAIDEEDAFCLDEYTYDELITE